MRNAFHSEVFVLHRIFTVASVQRGGVHFGDNSHIIPLSHPLGNMDRHHYETFAKMAAILSYYTLTTGERECCWCVRVYVCAHVNTQWLLGL